MLNRIRRILSKKVLSWEEYYAKITFLEMFYFQQNTRKQSINNGGCLKC